VGGSGRRKEGRSSLPSGGGEGPERTKKTVEEEGGGDGQRIRPGTTKGFLKLGGANKSGG